MAYQDDTINTPEQGTFSAPGQLFNKNAPDKVRKYLSPIAEERINSERSPGPGLRTRFGIEEQDVNDVRASPLRKVLNGSFSGVRAARAAHQNERDLWNPQAFPAVVGASDHPDPSDEDVEQQYQDYLLFSYLPVSLQTPEQDFRTMSKPSNRPAFLTGNLEKMGLRRPVRQGAPFAVGDDDPDTRRLLIASTFARSLNRGCAARLENLLGVNQ